MFKATRCYAFWLMISFLGLFGLSAHSLGDELKITTLSPGEGVKAEQGMQVSVHYQGRLSDGTIFDDSSQRGIPFTFTLGAGEVIEGWEKGIVGMQIGEQRQLVIPPELGYGLRGAGDIIPPGATLTFDVVLLATRWPPSLKTIDAEALSKTLADNPILIDIRKEAERAETGVIEGAVMITGFDETGQLHPEFQRKFAGLIKTLQTPFILYDTDGKQAAFLGGAMVGQLGFENVQYLEGGIIHWQDLELPLRPYQP